MKLSTRSTYAMRALVELALASGRGPVSAAHIAKRQSLSVAYLEQLLYRLRKQGLVGSIRGPRGGYVLAKDSARITMAEVVRTLDGPAGDGDGALRRPSAAAKPNGASKGRGKTGKSVNQQQYAEWISEAVRRCVHERLTQSLGAVTLQDLCDEARSIAGEPLDHRYVFHI